MCVDSDGVPSVRLHALPPPPDDVKEAGPVIEWWDEVFLPKADRAKLTEVGR